MKIVKKQVCPECGKHYETKLPGGRHYQGKTIREWAREMGMSHSTIYRRLKQGMSLEQAIFAPKGTHNSNSKPVEKPKNLYRHRRW